MDRLNWNDTPAFLAIARAGTLTAAAKLLGTGVATVSRKIERLEHALGVPLFMRHQTGYRLTDEGEALLVRAEELEEAMQGFQANAAVEAEALGHVRLATAENLANLMIIPSLPDLFDKHPGLSLEVLTDIATSNLHRRDADLAVRLVRPDRGNLTVRKIGVMGYGLYGASAYVDARRDVVPSQTSGDRFIGWCERQHMLPAAHWLDRLMRGDAPALQTSSLMGQVCAAQSGLGLAVLPHFVARDAGLHPVAIDISLEQAIWLVVHRDLSQSRRVRVVADHLSDVMSHYADTLSGRSKS